MTNFRVMLHARPWLMRREECLIIASQQEAMLSGNDLVMKVLVFVWGRLKKKNTLVGTQLIQYPS